MITDNSIYRKWWWERKYITSADISDPRPRGIRWIVRDGEKVLQQEVLVTVKFSEPVWKHADMVVEDSDYVWIDVLLEDCEEC